jgi:hypothetical protein
MKLSAVSLSDLIATAASAQGLKNAQKWHKSAANH